MQRDMGLIRRVVLGVENGEIATVVEAEPHAKEHIRLAIEAGLLMGQEMGKGNYPLTLLGLTSAGQEFAALARNDWIWTNVSNRIRERVGTTSFAVWLALLEIEHKKVISDTREPPI